MWSSAAAALVLAGLAVALLVPNTSQRNGMPTVDEGPAQLAVRTRTNIARADRAAINRLLDRFIPAGVRREDMRAAYELAGPEMRAAQSKGAFLRGDAPIPAYPANEKNYHQWQAIDVEKDAVILDLLVHPENPRTTGTWVFSIQVVRRDAQWLVNRIYTIAVMNPPTRPKTQTHELGPADYAAPPAAGASRGKVSKPTFVGKKGLIPALSVFALILLIPIGLGLGAFVRARRWKKRTKSDPRNTLPPLPSSYRKERDGEHELASHS